MIGRNDPCWCGSGKKWKKCHYPERGVLNLKQTPELAREYKRKYGILLKTPEQVQGIRDACKLAVSILEETCKQAKAGVTTKQLNEIAHQLHLDAGAIPAPLHYGEPPYPASICTSLNEVVCHGIPDDVPLVDGDVMNIDVSCIINGYFGDCSMMVAIGEISDEKRLVMDVAYESLIRSVAILKPGVLISEIGDVIEDYAHSKQCSVVHQFVGHGVGLKFHEDGPQVPHCRNSVDIPIAPGMTFTIEPMINAGVRDSIIDPDDEWTARTADGKASGQWEYTVLITDDGHEILTPWNRLH